MTLAELEKRERAVAREQQKITKERKKLLAQIEAGYVALWKADRDSPRFDPKVMDKAAFNEALDYVDKAGMAAYYWLDKITKAFHKRIQRAGTSRSDTEQEVFQISMTKDQPIDDDLVAAVKRVSLLVQKGDGPVYWSVFDRRLSSDGIHEMIVHPADWTASIGFTRYGKERVEPTNSLKATLKELAREHYYDGGPGYDEEAY